MECRRRDVHFRLRLSCGLLAIFAEFEREILRERTRAGLAHARQNGKRLWWPATVAAHAAEVRKLHPAPASANPKSLAAYRSAAPRSVESSERSYEAPQA